MKSKLFSLLIIFISVSPTPENLARSNSTGSEEQISNPQNALVDKRLVFNRTLLMFAAYNNRTDLIEELLNKGANPNLADEFGDTALILAAWKGHIDACNILIEAGAKKEHKNNRRSDFIDMAQRTGHTNFVNYFAKK